MGEAVQRTPYMIVVDLINPMCLKAVHLLQKEVKVLTQGSSQQDHFLPFRVVRSVIEWPKVGVGALGGVVVEELRIS